MILQQIQSKLKAPKNQFNSFGKYSYRSCEDILEGLKPLLAEHKAIILISDEIINLGDRYYVKATATLKAGEEEHAVTAYAREALTKKGMDDAQITGSASSYARKYALNGLLAIDDTKDDDTKKAEPTDWIKKMEEFVKENSKQGETPDQAFNRLTNNADYPKTQELAYKYYLKLVENKKNNKI